MDVLAEHGPTLGRPLVDTLTGLKLANLKELRPRQTNVRVLFVFDPWRSAILLVAGDKTGQWHRWYEGACPAGGATVCAPPGGAGEGRGGGP